MKLLTNDEEKFCQEMAKGVLARDAFEQIFPDADNSPKALAKFTKRKDIVDRVKELRNLAARVAIIDAAKVVEELGNIAFADVNDVMQYQRVCCRHCWGIDGAYQWKHEEEYAHSVAIVMDFNSKAEAMAQKGISVPKKELPSNKGGYGYRFNGEINNSCLNCFGEGLERTFIADSRTLSPAAKRLYGGFKQGREGVEIKLRDQDAALLNLAKYFKLLGNEPAEKNDGKVTINIIGGLPK